VLRETANVLMEGTPAGIDPGQVARAIEEDQAVLSCHHLHIWSLGDGRRALSGHLVLQDIPLSQSREVVERTNEMLRHRFAIDHTTLQVESGPCDAESCRQGADRQDHCAPPRSRP